MARKNLSEKSTSVTRKVDQLGRVVIPKELRKTFDIKDNTDLLEIYVEDDKIILKKYVPGCIFCGSEDSLSEFNEKMVCKNCIKKMAEAL